jgi:four helix bundle protein
MPRSFQRGVYQQNGGALQELDETVYWIELLAAGDLLNPANAKPVLAEADELIRIFVTCVKNANRT